MPMTTRETSRRKEIRWLPGIPVLLAALIGLASPSGAVAEVINRIVLRVNDRIATLQDYELRRAQLTGELLQQEMPAEDRRKLMEGLGERVFRDIFEDLLLQSRADQMGIRISEEQLNEVIDQIREDMGIPDEKALETALQQTGFTLAEFRENWRQNLRIQEVINREVRKPIQDDLSEDDLRRYYRAHKDEFMTPTQVQVREVVVLEDGPLSAEERQALAETIRSEIEAGRPLEEVVTPYAEDGRTSGVIDLGWIQHGELAKDLEEVVFNLPAGSCSRPLAARGGLHVIEVRDRREPELQAFDAVVSQIRAKEGRRLSSERVPAYMEDLEKTSYIKADPPPDAKDFRTAQGSVLEELEEVPEGTLAGEDAAGDAAEAATPPAGEGTVPEEGSEAPPV